MSPMNAAFDFTSRRTQPPPTWALICLLFFLAIFSAVLLTGCATHSDQAFQRNKAMIQHYFEDWATHGDKSAADRLIATNVVLHNPPAILHGLEEYKMRMAAFHKAFPDLRYTIKDQIAEADKIAVRWTLRGTQLGEYQGRPASGKKMSITGVSVFRIADGKIQEITVNMDRLGMMEQLGWLPAAPQPSR